MTDMTDTSVLPLLTTRTTGAPSAAGRPNALHRATLALERTRALDGASRLVAPLAEAVVGTPARRDALQGHWLGHSLHPILVMVPVGAWTSVSVLDLAGGEQARPAAQMLTGLGLLASVPSVVTGLAEWAGAGPRDRRTATVHAAVNAVSLVLYVRSWRARRRGQHSTGARLAAAGLGVAGVGGYLGGHLTEARKVSSRHPVYAASQ